MEAGIFVFTKLHKNAMTDNKPETGPAEVPTDNEAAPQDSGSANPEMETGPEDRMTQLESDNAELKDRVLRLMADMENLRRRTAREVKDASQYAIAGFARDMLGVGDNLRRALDALPEDAAQEADDTLKNLLEGVAMTEREMQNALGKHGIKKIDPEGEKFDPNFHQAMFEVPNPEIVSGTVVQVVQSGYVIGERVLRPAMVGVAKGGPKAPRPEAEASPAPEGPPASEPTAQDDPSAGSHPSVDKTA